MTKIGPIRRGHYAVGYIKPRKHSGNGRNLCLLHKSVVTKNAIKNIESVIVPLPKQIEPTTITKFLTDFVLIEVILAGADIFSKAFRSTGSKV